LTLPGPIPDHPYTAQSIADFIGWLEPGRLIVLLTLFKEAINRFIKRFLGSDWHQLLPMNSLAVSITVTIIVNALSGA